MWPDVSVRGDPTGRTGRGQGPRSVLGLRGLLVRIGYYGVCRYQRPLRRKQ
ncbi:hypothetical protein J2S55_002417 [Streptosporangium brasiliense]|uniref:Uncharacterized protein n=1 Tax=Streptosporangium brasiliense TaxID=47480 RepID=A0ABT9R2L9_9ACTN|nr:hypothetical protein [Streptosporangium brasiliense]